MVYVAGDNSISDWAKRDINEMEEVGSSESVYVVVQAELSTAYTPGAPASTIRGNVTRDENQSELGSWYTEIGNRNMTDPATLTDFITWTVTNYPADHYALVIWSHGAGWKADGESSKGMIQDLSSSGSSLMSLSDLADAVRNSGVVPDIINFDSCLMGMYEVAYEFMGTASYLVFSEDYYPVYGDPYDDILRDLEASPSMSPAVLVQTICARTSDSYEVYDQSMVKSAADLSFIDELDADMRSLAEYLIDHMDSEYENIEQARYLSLSMSSIYASNHDLGDFLEKLDALTDDAELQDRISNLQQTMSQMIIQNEIHDTGSSDDILEAHGLAIYLPSYGEKSVNDLIAYAALSCNQSQGVTWSDFVNQFSNIDPLNH